MPLWLGILTAAALVTAAGSAEVSEVRIDFSRSAGPFRPLHGINKGPLAPSGLLDVTEAQRALGIPFIRLHDCHWPNPDVVDMHAVFPNAEADPARPESYEFRLTDEYLEASRKTGAELVYRLGESIEHTNVKRFVHPPRDPERWAEAALGIVRHYNEGWAGGPRHDIRYWEIWNEPDNRPACWTGTDADYFRLYSVTARKIKARWPHLKVGGPGLGNTGELVQGGLQPSPFLTGFLEHCRREGLPLDFFSWHCYTADPAELAARGREVRRLLDSYGFHHTESHLNEWNYLPDGSWDGLSRTAKPEERQRFYERMAGAEGASFLAASLLELQDARVDVSCLFHGELGGFGLFNEHGVPNRAYHGVRAFQELRTASRRVPVETDPPGVTVEAGAGEKGCTVLLAGVRQGVREVRLGLTNLPWSGPTAWELLRVDGERSLDRPSSTGMLGERREITVRLDGPGVVLLRLRSGS